MSFSPQVPQFKQAPSLFPLAETGHEEMVRLVSLVRALSPELPPVARYYRRGPADRTERQSTPGRLMLTHDDRAELSGGLNDASAQDLFDVLDRLLPAPTVAALRARLDQLPHAGHVTALNAGMEAAEARGLLVSVRPTHDLEVVIESSSPLTVAPLAFAEDPFLTEVAEAHLSRRRQVGEDISFDFISDLGSVRQALSADVARFSASRVADLSAAIGRLNGRDGDPTFEQRQNHGWVAFSLLAGGQGWTSVLLKQEGIDPHAHFRGVSPLVAAIAADDAVAVQKLAEAGAPVNARNASKPSMFAPQDQQRFEKEVGSFTPMVVLATALGKPRALAALVGAGADIDAQDELGQTSLHVAVASGSDALVRTVLNQGGRIDVANLDGQTPSDLSSPAVKAVLEGAAALEPSVRRRTPGM